MTECYSARCQQDRKLARREFNKWNKNLLFQVGLESIAKNYFEFDANFIPNIDETIPVDFNSNQTCLFCFNRKEYLDNQKSIHRTVEYPQSMIDDDENAPLDLSLKSTTQTTTTTNNSRTNIKQRSMFDIKSDIPSNYGQEEFDRLMFDMITSQIDYSSPSYLNMNLFPTLSIPPSPPITKKKTFSSSPDVHIAQLAKQMAYERMLEEINSQRHSTNHKKSKNSIHSSPSILTESLHVNHILHDVMMKILHEIYEKQQQTPTPPRASRKGELLFVKKQNNDEQYNFIRNHKNHEKIRRDNQSSSSSSTSSISSTGSSSIHRKIKTNKSSNNYIPKGRSNEIISNHNSKIPIGMDGKQIRPKRGQYRRYESEQLAKAVAAVLSNEMSVHKAGSYFGVPHSTLEYKVKERNIKIKSKDEEEDKSFSTSLNSSHQDHDLEE